jgi:FkbM family methyltransferase
MKLNKGQINGIQFYHREGMSDLKTFEEVLRNEVYLKKGMTIQLGETWMDCGGNVGAFTLLACSKGAKVTVYEPDPFNCEMIKKNLSLNGFQATVKQAALVHNDTKEIILFIGNNGNVWRNSIVKKWNNKGIKVPCLNFDSESKNFDCCKMDIEGAEMLILENTKKIFNKLVYEWSFDIDASLSRFWSIIDKQIKFYQINYEKHRTCHDDKRESVWQKSWFPACTNVFCYEKN